MTTLAGQPAPVTPDDAPEFPTLSPTMRSHHRWMLVIAAIVVVLSVAFDVRPDQRVFFRGLPDFPMPGTCPSREVFHVDCPGCGLTRSFVFLAHGQWGAAWHVNRVGWALAIAVLAQFPYRILCLRRGQAVLPRWALRAFSGTLIAMLIGNWVIGLWH